MKSMIAKYIGISACLAAIMCQSCESFTEVDQKGMNLLTKTSDLELLLNANYSGSYGDMGVVCGDVIDGWNTGYLPELSTKASKNYNEILTLWDEAEHASRLPLLTEDDGDYERFYSVIGRIANPILQRVDAAKGSEEHKARLKAEAYTLRAYFHFLAAQKYARAYDPATAETEQCMPYLMDDWDIQIPTSQLTQKDFYGKILADLDRAIELKSLPEQAINHQRFGAAMPYAVKAHVMMAMRDLDGAASAAREALKHGGEISDYATMLEDDLSYGGVPVKKLVLGPKLLLAEDYFTSCSQNLFNLMTPFCESMFEEGSYKLDNYPTTFLNNRGLYDPSDLDNDLKLLKENALSSYGVPYNTLYDMKGQNNLIGIKTTHMYLILAECAIEGSNINEGMGYLDTIRRNRISPDHYHDLKNVVDNRADAIRWLKKTCHGEYVWSMWNFFCRKRWNMLADYKETFTRELCGKTYTLTPESDLWVFPLPLSVMAQNHNLKHNYPTNIK